MSPPPPPAPNVGLCYSVSDQRLLAHDPKRRPQQGAWRVRERDIVSVISDGFPVMNIRNPIYCVIKSPHMPERHSV